MIIPNHHLNERLFFLEETKNAERDFDEDKKSFLERYQHFDPITAFELLYEK